MKKIKNSIVVLFGTPSDPEVKQSMDLIKKTGRKVETTPRASFDTGIGHCGKHICSCRVACAASGQNITGAYSGDAGATMGTAY